MSIILLDMVDPLIEGRTGHKNLVNYSHWEIYPKE